jgi:hypothetical protein
MLTNDGIVKIIDLGLGTFYSRELGNALRTFCGSPDCKPNLCFTNFFHF